VKFTQRSGGASRIITSTAFLVACGFSSLGQSQIVALTFDDLPAVGTQEPIEAEFYNRAILNSLTKHHAPQAMAPCGDTAGPKNAKSA
jgi:hypothetical protein